MRRLIAFLCAAAACAPVMAAEPPGWLSDPCAGVDCSSVYAGVGQADLLPVVRISSALAYAEAARRVGERFGERMAINERVYGENAAESADSAVRDVMRSPLGAAMTKTYGDAEADVVSVTVDLKPLAAGVTAYAQEFVDPEARTLYVRLLLPRASSAAAPPGAPWRGASIRVASEDLRAGRRNEFFLLAQDRDAGLTWVERWPGGGADLLKDGEVAAKYVYDRARESWGPAPASAEPPQPPAPVLPPIKPTEL